MKRIAKKKRPIRDRNRRSKRAAHAIHKVNSAGAKNLMRWFKAKNEISAENVEQASAWYRSYLAERDAQVRRRDAARKARRLELKKAA